MESPGVGIRGRPGAARGLGTVPGCRFVQPGARIEFGTASVLASVSYGRSAAHAGEGLRVDVPLAALGAPLLELWTAAERPRRVREGALELALTEELAFGVLALEERELEADVERAYDQILSTLARLSTRHLLRMWNIVPRINAPAAGHAGLDRYMLFCRARSLAFERHHGAHFDRTLSAASAVGSEGGPFVTYFLAGVRPGERVSNPRQEEPWLYPSEYGPRAPSFARALAAPAPFEGTLFISGTASIVGHASVHAHDLAAQTGETLRNLGAVAEAANLGLDARLGLKVYLRDPARLPEVRAQLREAYGPETPVLFLRADICRRELDIEIEAVAHEAR